MKKIIFLLTLACAILANDSFAQKYRKKETTLISFKIYITPDYMAKFSEYSNLFRKPVKPGVNRITSHLTSDIWDMVKQKLTSDVGMLILPIDAYGNKFNYDQYGFPDVSINKALQRGNSKLYIKVDVEISPEFESKYLTKSSSDSSTQLVQLTYNEIKPKITIKMNIFNDKGVVPVANCIGEAVSSKVITLNDKYFDGFVNTNIAVPHETLYKLVDQAIKGLIISVYTNK